MKASRDLVVVTFALVASTFLPWAKSGRVTRSGWEMVASARRLDVVDSDIAEVLLVAFFILPMVAFLMLNAHALSRYGAVAALGVFVVVISASVAVAVSRSPLDSRWGLWLSIVIACAEGVLVTRLVRHIGR